MAISDKTSNNKGPNTGTSRRGLIKNASVLGASGILASSAAVTGASLLGTKADVSGGGKTSGAQELRVGVIGVGRRGLGLASTIAKIDGLKLTSICDVRYERLEECAKATKLKLEQFYDYRKLLDNKNIDAVVIATPFSFHADMAIDAVSAGKHIYCEKTLSYGFDQTQRLLKAAKGSRQIFQTGHQFRSSAAWREVVKRCRDGEIGNITHVDCKWHRNSNWRRPVTDPKMERLINWRMYREYSGGLVAELNSHHMDFVQWLIDSLPTEISGMGGINYYKDGRETFDNVQLAVRYANGVSGAYSSILSNSHEGVNLSIYGDKGTFIIDSNKVWKYLERAKEDIKKGTVDGVTGATVNSWTAGGELLKLPTFNPTEQALQEFRKNILAGQQPSSNLLTGARTAVSVQMAIDAMREGKTQYWNSEVFKV